MDRRSMSSPAAAGLGDWFTEADLAAADQLVQLSVSGGGEEDQEASSSSSLSARSVNNAEAGEASEAREEAKEEDDESGLDRRARKRYRLVSELYAATRPVKGGGKRKREEMIESARDRERSEGGMPCAGPLLLMLPREGDTRNPAPHCDTG